MLRSQNPFILEDLSSKYVFLAGPRQSGKTTLAKSLFEPSQYQYFSYDKAADRRSMLKGLWDRRASLIIFDEFHKFPKWKTYLKGYFDTEGVKPPIIVTGSARLNVFRKGNDSMLGRSFYHRLLPFSVQELVVQAKKTPDEAVQSLLKYGNFPEPFLRASDTFSKRWRNNFFDRILREDLRDLSHVRSITKIQLLIDLLRERVGNTVSYNSLAQDLEVSPGAVKDWIDLLEQLYVVFRVTPYSNRIARSIRKEPKIYFFDCNMAFDENAHYENLVAVSLLKHLWFLEDTQGQRVALHFLRTKDKHEIDFALVQDRKVTALVEVKKADAQLSGAFRYFQECIPNVQMSQIVFKLDRPLTAHGVQIEPAAQFLARLAV